MFSGRGHGVGNPLPGAKPLRTLKTAMAAIGKSWHGFGFGATPAWGWRHIGLGSAPRRLGAALPPGRRAAPPELASPAVLRHD